MTSSKKDWALTQIRARYESKFGTSEIVKQLLNSELAKIAIKDKITSEDLKDLESKLSLSAQILPSKGSHVESTPRKNIISPRQTRFKSGELDPKLIKSLVADSQFNLEKRESSISSLKPNFNDLSTTTTLPPIATNHLHPMELKILKSYESLPYNDKLSSPTRTEVSLSHQSPNKRNLSPKMTEMEEYRLPFAHKTIEREKQMKQNIWKKLDEYNLKKAEEEEQMRVDKAKKQRENWLMGLNKQMLEKQKLIEEEKTKEKQAAQKCIETDVQIHVDQEQKEREHKKKLRAIERDNYLAVAREKDHIRKIKSLEREIEVIDMNNKVEEYENEKKKKEEDKLRKKKMLQSMKTDDFTSQAQKLRDRLAQEKEEDTRATEGMMEKLIKEEEKSANYLKMIKAKSKNIRDAEPAIEKGYDNLRRYGEIGNGEHKDGIMHFLYLDTHNEEIQNDKKKKHQLLLKEKYMQQRGEKEEKSKQYKSYIDEQKDLWKKEEEDMNLREEVGNRVKNLKKYALKEELDRQIEVDSALKNHYITPTEVWVNRKVLKELKAIPEKHSDKMSYLRDL